jgi:phosphopantothenoylcysteine decarboxylase / phosphopantothenate---cysteine ligase
MNMAMRLKNKRILLGITGGIAAYKAAELVRLLKREGAVVRVVMTDAAMAFITPLSLQALSGNPVHTRLLDEAAEAGMGHIELARWADAILVAPATADFIARLTHGHGNDLLTTVCLAAKAPLAIAPAMNQQMWAAKATLDNIQTLKLRGISIWGPEEGEQACGDLGFGRMSEPDTLLQEIENLFKSDLLTGLKIVITAGPTQEYLDPVRYLSNKSSGKMGYAFAEACCEAGADVTLISGPVALTPPQRVSTIFVTSALEMQAAVQEALVGAHVFISTAAVADYRFESTLSQKLKKETDRMRLACIQNPDILAEVARCSPRPYCIGFAAETENLLAHAKKKLVTKKIDMLIANLVGITGQGFEADDNAVTILTEQTEHVISRRPKAQLARELVKYMTPLIRVYYDEKN